MSLFSPPDVSFRRIGHGGKKSQINEPAIPPKLANVEIRYTSHGYEYMYFLTKEGKLFVCGRNNYSQFGNNTTSGATVCILVLIHNSQHHVVDSICTVFVQTPLAIPFKTQIKRISCGRYFGMVLTVDRCVWVTGYNGNRNLGKH